MLQLTVHRLMYLPAQMALKRVFLSVTPTRKRQVWWFCWEGLYTSTFSDTMVNPARHGTTVGTLDLRCHDLWLRPVLIATLRPGNGGCTRRQGCGTRDNCGSRAGRTRFQRQTKVQVHMRQSSIRRLCSGRMWRAFLRTFFLGYFRYVLNRHRGYWCYVPNNIDVQGVYCT